MILCWYSENCTWHSLIFYPYSVILSESNIYPKLLVELIFPLLTYFLCISLQRFMSCLTFVVLGQPQAYLKLPLKQLKQNYN